MKSLFVSIVVSMLLVGSANAGICGNSLVFQMFQMLMTSAAKVMASAPELKAMRTAV